MEDRTSRVEVDLPRVNGWARGPIGVRARYHRGAMQRGDGRELMAVERLSIGRR